MHSIQLALIAFGCILTGVAAAVLLRRALPEHHLNDNAKDVVRLGTGLVATIAALVLGLLIASAKTSYDTQAAQVRQITANAILLDLMLEQYGPEARPARDMLRRNVNALADQVWHESRDRAPFRMSQEGEGLYSKIQSLQPGGEAQRFLQARAIQGVTDLAQTRLLLFVQKNDGLPMPFLGVLVFWLTIIFLSFTLFAKPSPIVIGALMIFALSATGALYLILELSQPFSGLLQISSEPLRDALSPLSP
jgi:hypothetical protein